MSKQSKKTVSKHPKKFSPTKEVKSQETISPVKNEKSNRVLVFVTALLIAFLGSMLYMNTSKHEFNLDDFSVIVDNMYTKQGTKAIPDIFKNGYRAGIFSTNDVYRPLTKAMFAWEYEKSGQKSGLSHSINIALYGALCGFIFLLLNRFFPRHFYVSVIATLLFTVHPIHTEVVANIKSRDELLAMFFALISLWYGKNFADKGNFLWLLPMSVFYGLALFTKESAITFVALLPVTLYFFSKISTKHNVIATLCLLVVSGIYLKIHFSVVGTMDTSKIPVPDNSLMATKDFIVQRMTAIEIMGRYLKLLVFPHPLSCDYSFSTIPLVESAANGPFLLAFIVHCAGLYYAFKGLKSKKIYSYAILYYFITISIVCNVFMLIGTNMAERLVFMPSLGFCILIAYFITRITKSIDFTPQKFGEIFSRQSLNWVILVPVLFLFSVKTISRNKDWKNVSTLFNKDVNTVPNSVHMLYYHANMLMNSDSLKLKQGEELQKTYDIAEKELRQCVKIYEPFAEVHGVLAKICQNTNRLEDALTFYKRRIELNDKDPTIYNNYGTCYGFLGRTDEAEQNFMKAIEKSTDCYADALCNMATVYVNRGSLSLQQRDLKKAEEHYKKAIEYSNQTIECKWDTPLAYKYLGISYEALGDKEKAKKYYSKAQQIESSNNSK